MSYAESESLISLNAWLLWQARRSLLYSQAGWERWRKVFGPPHASDGPCVLVVWGSHHTERNSFNPPSSLWEVFPWETQQSVGSVKCFLGFSGDSFYPFILVLCDINWFALIGPSLHHWGKSHLVVLYGTLVYCWVWYVEIRVRISASPSLEIAVWPWKV